MSDWMDEYMYTCPICGKERFILNPKSYAYKVARTPHKYYFCSYKCLRKYEKENPIRTYNKVL